MLVYGNFVALYYLFCVCVILSELPSFFMMSNNEIDNVLEPTAVVDKIKSPTLDHLTCQLAAEVPGDQQQNFPCSSSNIKQYPSKIINVSSKVSNGYQELLLRIVPMWIA